MVDVTFCFDQKPYFNTNAMCPVLHKSVEEILKKVCDVLVFVVPPVTIGNDESQSHLSLSRTQEMSRMLVQTQDLSPTNPTV